MVEARILPESFDEMTVEQAVEILGRRPDEKPLTAWMLHADDLKERPDTFAFRTREGTMGLLQFETAGNAAGTQTIRYRLGRPD